MKGEISGSVCNFNKDKLSDKPEQIQVLLRILSVWCGGVRTRETLNSLALCMDMRKGPFTVMVVFCLLIFLIYILPPTALKLFTGRTGVRGKNTLGGLSHISFNFVVFL